MLCSLGLSVVGQSRAAERETLRVMTFNIWVGGESGGQPLDQTVKVIQAAKADVVGIQEGCGKKRRGKCPDRAKQIAEKLGWNYFSQGDDDTSIMSRYTIVDHSPKKWGAAIGLPSAKRVWVFNAHFSHAPYQPYQLLKIPYEDGPFINTADEAMAAARDARQGQVESMLAEVAVVREQNTPIFITGDFNEPSSLDWTEAVFRAERCPRVVPWPTTAAVYNSGFVDTYRQVHTDPLKKPGYTWTPTTSESDPQDHHDRIDFVMVGGPGVKVAESQVVGENSQKADIVVTPYPSDHRAVVATVNFE
jgi:endonuclease/exonuclease/phosphatase family metal-dependent hydrolase